MDQKDFFAELDKLPVETVQENYDLGLYAGRKKDWSGAWLKKQKRITPWFKTWQGKALIGLTILVVGGAATKFLFG